MTLPLELPIRVAEDAAVLDLISGGRLEVGVGPGGNLSAFEAFGLDSAERGTLLAGHLQVLRDAWAGRPLAGGDRLYPSTPHLVDRIWQATFTVEGARRAGAAGDGLMLSRAQPRPADAPDLSLAEIQNPMIDALSGGAAAKAGSRASSPRARCSWPTIGKEAQRLRRSRTRAPSARLATIGPHDRQCARSSDLIAALRRPSRHAGRGDRLAPGGQRARPRDRLDGAGAFDRPAASLHPAVDRAGGRGGGAPPSAGNPMPRQESGASRDDKETMSMPETDADVIDTLVGIAPGSPLDAISRPPARGAHSRAGELPRAVRAGDLRATSRPRSASR